MLYSATVCITSYYFCAQTNNKYCGFYVQSLYLLVELLLVRAELSFFLSAMLSVTVVFLGNKFFTFKNKGAITKQLLKFSIIYGTSIALNVVLSTILFAIGLHYLLAKALAIGLIIIWNYSFSKWWIFKESGA